MMGVMLSVLLGCVPQTTVWTGKSLDRLRCEAKCLGMQTDFMMPDYDCLIFRNSSMKIEVEYTWNGNPVCKPLMVVYPMHPQFRDLHRVLGGEYWRGK